MSYTSEKTKTLTQDVIEEVFEECKKSEIMTHLWHLQTKSYAEHIALEEYYTSLQTFLDSFIECWQGKTGVRIEGPSSLSILSISQKDVHFEKLCYFLDEVCCDYLQADLDLQDILLDIKNLVNKTKYLLTLN